MQTAWTLKVLFFATSGTHYTVKFFTTFGTLVHNCNLLSKIIEMWISFIALLSKCGISNLVLRVCQCSPLCIAGCFPP